MAVQNVYSDQFQIFNECNTAPCAAALLKIEKRSDLRKLKLQLGIKNEQKLNIQEDVPRQNLIINSVQDLIVFGTSKVRNSYFDKILDKKLQLAGSYFIRDITESAHTNLLSLNHCSSFFKGFSLTKYKLGRVSKGQVNNCEGEFIIPSWTPAVQIHPPILLNTGNPQLAQDNAVASAGTSSAWINPYRKPVFQTGWIELCKTSLINEARSLHLYHIQSWLSISVQGNDCFFKCHICNSYFNVYGLRPDIRHKPDIAKPAGYKSTPNNNMNAIRNHGANEIHVKALAFFNNLLSATTKQQYDNIVSKEINDQQSIYLATMNVIKSLYFIIKSNNPLAHHPRQIKLLQHFGVPVGNYQHNNVAADKIAQVISDTFHIKLLRSLVDRQVPFCLLADESTDVSSVSYMVVLFHTVEDDDPIVYFYSLVELTGGQTADAMFSSLESQILKDDRIVPGFLNFFKSNIAAILSDGASSMTGIFKSIHTNINTFIKPRKVSLFHCAAHRIQLTMQTAIGKQDLNYFSTFDKKVNKFYNFYMSRGSKKWLHLQKIAEELEETKPRRMRYVFTVRWAAAQFAAVKSLHDDYLILKVDLVALTFDSTFDQKSRDTAQELHGLLSDRTFSIVLREFLDFLTVFKQMSLVFQEQAGLLVGKSRTINEGLKMFESLKSSPGSYVSNFLKECHCRSGCSMPNCNIYEYDYCKHLVHRDNLLERIDNNGIRLSLTRIALYNSLISELKRRFNDKIIGGMDLFDTFQINFVDLNPDGTLPAALPMGKIETYYKRPNANDILFTDISYSEKIEIVCEFYHLSVEDCKIFKLQWVYLIRSVTRNKILIEQKQSLADTFWPLALKQSTLLWTSITKRIIALVLSTGKNNAASERSFSLMSQTKSKSRAQTSPELLESYIRIRENGPSLENFNAIDYTIEFFKKGYTRADEPENLGGRPSKNTKYRPKKSKIF